MDQGWAAVIAAGVAGVVALIGAFIGVWLGRRTVRDQAQVEHQQWLRGQRQEAYVAFVAEWDELLPKFEDLVLDEHQMEILDQEDGWDEANMAVVESMHQDLAPLRRAAERILMLGPDPVERAATAMVDAAEDVLVGIGAQYVPPEEGHERLEEYWRAVGQTDARRSAFLQETRKVLRQAPDTKRS
ncbi:hypothetical protein [Streptomyces sp. NPDC056194]|uniref:hypothetical protein n=1 Tax=Streptomyces sp. NPDC056194 TaxID=3345744 RepID=UPI0035D97683